MAVHGMGSLVLWTARLEACRAFYEALGLPLEDEQHEEGPRHFACQVGGVHVALYGGPAGEAPGKGAGGSSLVGFRVDEVDELFGRLTALGAEVIWAPCDAPWGRTAQVRDPDGRPVELFATKGGA